MERVIDCQTVVELLTVTPDQEVAHLHQILEPKFAMTDMLQQVKHVMMEMQLMEMGDLQPAQ